MADFVAVLRKTVGALGDNTPEMREKVFEKARATIDAKLKAIQPPPPQPVVDRQRKALEDAIAIVKADYEVKAGPDKDETLEDIFASLKSLGEPKPQERLAAPASAPALPPRPAERIAPEVAAKAPEVAPPETAAPVVVPPLSRNDAVRAEAAVSAPDPVLAVDEEEKQGPPEQNAAAPVTVEDRPRRRIGGGLVAAAIALLIVAGAGYGIWVNRDDFAAMAGLGSTSPAEDAATTAGDLAPPAGEDAPPVEAEAPQQDEPEQEIAALPPAGETTPPASEEPGKFTQRLLPDGTEVDEGPADGPRSIGEGSSVAAATQAGQPAATDASPDEGSPGETAQVEPAASQTPTGQVAPAAVAVGQKAIFYEERTTSASGSAEVGNIVWSMVTESTGGDAAPEPAIRAEATIPGKDIQLRMTIRRNGDQTLPASHIIEMIFLTPEGFEGGGIANVSRISFKETEQAAGSALIGIPAKIADGFFLIALGDTPAEIEANLGLLRRQSWLDIPIVYQTGRRALLTLEKGIPGERVFEEAVRAWTEASSG